MSGAIVQTFDPRKRPGMALQNLHPRFKSGRRLQSKLPEMRYVIAETSNSASRDGTFWTEVSSVGPENLHPPVFAVSPEGAMRHATVQCAALRPVPE